MELRVSAQEPGLSPSECESDPDEKEISDDDDDDRNHKHRRREEARSQSLEGGSLEQVFTKPFRKGNKSFENGHLFREAGSQSGEAWKNYNFNPMEKEASVKFEKRRPGFTQFSRAPSDLNQRIRVNQAFPGDPGPVRGRGRDSGLWSQRDSRFSSVDIAAQIVQQGSVPPTLFAGRGLPTVSNAHGPSWGAFGLVPGIPNGGLDTLHPLGLQGSYRSAINPSLNMGLARQRCRDFEEQGFCLRGDMCPMEHGVNRIVVEDVQSLSQFNLPVSLPSAHLPGAAGPGPLPTTSTPTSSLLNSKASHVKNGKRGVGDNGLGLNGVFSDSAAAAGSDFYDPDQPLWGNDGQTSTALQSTNQSNIEESEPLLDPGACGDHRVGLSDGSDNERVIRSAGTAVGSQSTSSSVWGRISNTKNKTEMRENTVSKPSSSNFIQNEATESQETPNGAQGAPHNGKRNNIDSSPKMPSGNGRSVRKPSQKAQRTLFVNGIPQQSNKRESLLSHFQKFGEVIDIYIPLNSERAFVQFSKREEAEAALAAPDAVMGNRFIKLWWANRDNIPDNVTISNSMQIPRGATLSSTPSGISVANKGKGDPQSTLHNGILAPPSAAPMPASDHLKPPVANGPKAPPPLLKKLESLEVLKEELRKKQEMLDQKRNDFRRKLDKLEKQATGTKMEVIPEQVAKKQKLGIVGDSSKAATRSSSDTGTIPSPRAEMTANDSKSEECAGPQSSRTTAIGVLQESFRPSIRPLVPAAINNRFKLDNRPTSFKIIPPLPNDLANVDVLKEHFSTYGDLSTVELDDSEAVDGHDDPKTSTASARIYFTTRHSAEKAFSGGKCWKGHNLQFSWLKSRNSSKDVASGESPLPTPKGTSDASVQPVVEDSRTASVDPATSRDGESKNLEKKDIVKEHLEPDASNHSS